MGVQKKEKITRLKYSKERKRGLGRLGRSSRKIKKKFRTT